MFDHKHIFAITCTIQVIVSPSWAAAVSEATSVSVDDHSVVLKKPSICMTDPVAVSSATSSSSFGSSTNGRDDDVLVLVHLFLVRHGETEDNLKGLVIGQSDSPLTSTGREQAQLLGRSSMMQEPEFHMIYSSDLSRARDTAEIIVQEQSWRARRQEGDEPPQTVIVDARLREIAKGAREGMPRTMTYQEALEVRQQQQQQQQGAELSALPRHETLEEAWDRFCDFLKDMIQSLLVAAHNNDNRPKQEKEPPSAVTTSTSSQNYNVLIVAHSGLLRVVLQRLLGEQVLKRHPDARFEESTGLFFIPNTSVTVLQVRIPQQPTAAAITTVLDDIVTEQSKYITVQEMTWAKHLNEKDLAEATANGE